MLEASAGSLGRTQSPKHRDYTWGVPMPLLGTDSVVPRAYKPLLSVGSRRNSVDRIARSSAEGDHLGSEHDVGNTMDRRK